MNAAALLLSVIIIAIICSNRITHSFIVLGPAPLGMVVLQRAGAAAMPALFSSHDDDDSVNDWAQAELAMRNFPLEPSPDIEPIDVVNSCLRSLQFVDHPNPSSGLERCFPFFTWECRKVVTARKGGDTVERFVKYGQLAPALQPFMGATRIEIGEGTYTVSDSPTRGDIISFPVVVRGSMVLAFQHCSGMIKDGISTEPPVTNMVVRLERNRRPPMQDCWLVREVLDVRYAFQGDMGNAHVGE